MSRHKSHDIATTRSQRHPDADLVGSPGDGESEHTIQSNGRERQGESPKAAQQCGGGAFLAKSRVSEGLQCPHIAGDQLLIEIVDLAANGHDQPHRVSRYAHLQAHPSQVFL